LELGDAGKIVRPTDTATTAPKKSGEFDVHDLDNLASEVLAPKPPHLAQAGKQEQHPKIYQSLPTGTPFCDGDETGGKGVLEIENGTPEDAALRLYDVSTKRIVRCLFVKTHESLQVTGIPEGAYVLKYSTGLDWQVESRAFRWLPSYSQFDRQLVYSEEHIGDDIRYHEIKVTLQPVIGGNVRAVPISREEFLRGTQDAEMQR
jgi:hypothetical protein